MLTRAQEKLVRATLTKKGREKTGRCLVEGETLIREAGDLLEFTFDWHTTPGFKDIVTTTTPQPLAGIARLPTWADEVIASRPTIIVLDGVQDPGNVGVTFRLALGFDAAVIIVGAADPTSPKVIRSSAGAIFHVPWKSIGGADVADYLATLDRPIYRLEKRPGATPITNIAHNTPFILIVGSEGQGIHSTIDAPSLFIPHRNELESLNVSHALAIALYESKQTSSRA